MLKILPEDHPRVVEQVVVVLYGQPSIGKTTLALTASKPVLLDFDAGSHRAGWPSPRVEIGSWRDVVDMEPDDFAAFDTVVIDTAGRALDFLTAQLIHENPRLKTRTGGLTINGWGDLGRGFETWLNLLRTFGLDVVIVCHAKEVTADETTELRIKVPGGSKDLIYQVADLMGHLGVTVNGQGRMLDMNPRPGHFGKNPCYWPSLELTQAFVCITCGETMADPKAPPECSEWGNETRPCQPIVTTERDYLARLIAKAKDVLSR